MFCIDYSSCNLWKETGSMKETHVYFLCILITPKMPASKNIDKQRGTHLRNSSEITMFKPGSQGYLLHLGEAVTCASFVSRQITLPNMTIF